MLTWKINEEKDYRKIREEVFIKEQGFQEEFDEIDQYATHITLYVNQEVIGCGRVFSSSLSSTSYTLGRLAILKAYRAQGYGETLVKLLEEQVKKLGGKEIILHAQVRAIPFYEKLGYEKCSEIEMEEHVPHMYMKKAIL
ncbi:MAG: GNAT family N-acetyltransferase [Erysipelotrichaceae bacterium]|nr:GNAT family N-acetyltransferase [Erysipelotrichaceae bacterium]